MAQDLVGFVAAIEGGKKLDDFRIELAVGLFIAGAVIVVVLVVVVVASH